MRPLAVRIPGKSLSLMPACCIHWPIGERDLLSEWVGQLKSNPDARTILMGDSLDLARSHYRNHVRSYREDENSQEALDGYAREEVRKLAKVLDPVKDKIWGAIRGNHYWEFSDGTNSEQYLCQLLGIPYLGVMGLIRVAFCIDKSHSSNTKTIIVFAHHSGGTSGARTTGGDVSSAARSELGFDCDVYLVGHTHRRIAWKDSTLTLTSKGEPRLVERSKVFARCGSFLKGCKEDRPNATQQHLPNYAEVRAYRPSDLGWVTVNVLWRESMREKVRDSSNRVVQRGGVVYPQYTLVY